LPVLLQSQALQVQSFEPGPFAHFSAQAVSHVHAAFASAPKLIEGEASIKAITGSRILVMEISSNIKVLLATDTLKSLIL
jgi:hypothetical protein